MSKIFNKWVKSEADLIAGGLSKTSLINDTKIYVTGNSINKRLDEAITDGDIGGGGGINHVTNNEMASNITGYNTYKDAVDVIPENGTAGTATVISISRNTTTPLRNLADLKIAKSGSNGKGEGVSYDVTVDLADQSQIMELSFDYRMTSGYADNDFSIFLYDVTNNVLIRFNGEELKAKSPYGKFIAFPQLSSNSTSYRIIFHCVSTSTTAYDIFVDNVKLGPNNDVAISALANSAIRYSGHNANGSTNTSIRRYSTLHDSIGSDILVTDSATLGMSFTVQSNGIYTITASEATSSGYNYGIQKNSTTAIFTTSATNRLAVSTIATSNFAIPVVATVYLLKGDVIRVATDGTTSTTGDKALFTMTRVDKFDTTSAEYSGRFHTVTAYLSSTQAISTTSSTKININAVAENTTGMFNSGSNRIDILESGYYDILAKPRISGMVSSGTGYVQIRKNGTAFLSEGFAVNPNAGDEYLYAQKKGYPLIKGDYIEFYMQSAGDSNYNVVGGTVDESQFYVTKIANPVDVVKSNETIFLDAAGNGGGSPVGSSGNIDFTEITDSHGAWDGTTFTVPVSGDYSINASIKYSASVAGRAIYLYVNGSLARTITYSDASLQIYTNNIVYRLVKGQTVNIRHSNTQALSNDTNSHWLTIRKFN